MSIKIIPVSVEQVVELLSIGDVDQGSATMKRRQRAQFLFLGLAAGLKKQAERRFDQLGHGLTLSSCFPPETAHDGIVNVKRSLRMENHIHDMAICQPSIVGGVVGQAFARRPQPAGESPADPPRQDACAASLARCGCRSYICKARSARES